MWSHTRLRVYHGQRWPNVTPMIQARCINSGELVSPYKRVSPAWFKRRGAKPGYPSMQMPDPTRKIGVDKNLQERLDELFLEENNILKTRTDIGFPKVKVETPVNNRAKMIAFKRDQRNNKELERAARLQTLEVTVDQVRSEHLSYGGHFKDIFEAADLYGVFEDLYGPEKLFHPCVDLKVHYDYDEEYITPVHRGNIIKPSEAQATPHVSFSLPESSTDQPSLWTLVMSNPDGHFTDENSEYLHWMVANIPGNKFADGQTICSYLQPFPPYGSGYHRYIFVLYKQKNPLDLSDYKQPEGKVNLKQRTFRTYEFLKRFDGELIPAGLAFFQSDYDSSLRNVFHDVLEMREPRFEYNFIPSYIKPWLTAVPQNRYVGFNHFLDRMRDPKEIQEEVLKKKLKLVDPVKGNLDANIKFPNAHGPQFHRYQDTEVHGSWRLREIERERLRQGIYKDMDWTHLRRDPTEA